MAVTDQQLEALHAYLSANSEAEAAEAERRFIVLARTGEADGIGELLYAAFVIAARQAFAPTWESADIVRFVADVRSSSGEASGILNPAVAEDQLRAALGQELAGHSDEEARARAQLILLAALTARCPPPCPRRHPDNRHSRPRRPGRRTRRGSSAKRLTPPLRRGGLGV
jgi:hypothetical protein